MAYNKIILSGNLTREPELNTVGQFNTDMCKFGLAVNSKVKDKDEVLFIDCVMFGKLAEILGKYLHKGSPILVDGRLHQSFWDDNGKKRSNVSVVIDSFTFLGKNPNSDNSESTSPKQQESKATKSNDDCPI